ncbi:MAG TPA: hypothetical protein VF355_03345 [Anaerolineaceae bacterium]|jgi:hypothetical protein
MVEETQPAEQTGPVEEEQEETSDEQQPEGVSPEDLKALKLEAETKIDAFMKQVGYNPPDRTDETGWRYFTLGSADGRAGIVQVENNLYLRVEALVMSMPSDKELILPLMRELLNLNIELSGPVRLGIEGDNVYTSLLYPVKALKDEEYPDMIHWTMNLADQIDEGLIKKYGGTSKTRGEQPQVPQQEGDHA